MLTEEYIRSRLSYDPETGVFVWKRREVHKTEHKAWNARWEGKVAGSIAPNGYIQIDIQDMRYSAHRLAWFFMTGEWPKEEIDHISQNRSDNRWINLREASHSQNKWNTAKKKNNTSGHKGVSFHKATGRWRADLKAGDFFYYGIFRTKEAAIDAYAEASAKYHCEFGST